MTAASRAAVKTFRSLAGTPEAKCLHTVYVHSHLQSGFTTPTLASASPEVVVPIRPSSSAHAQPYAYWTDGTFVLYNAISGQLRCSQESHKGQCPHIEHVSSHMQENGSDAFDEQDYSQVSHHVVLLDRPGSICHQSASNELYNHNQFLIYSGSIAEPCKILT